MARFKKVAIAFAVVGLGVVALWRSNLFAPKKDSTAQAAALVDRGKRVYGQINMEEVPALGSPAQVRVVLERAFAGDRGGDQPPDELLHAVSEFIYYRFVQTSLQQYKSWRYAAGYRLVSADVMRKNWLVDSDYEAIFDEPYPGDDKLEQVFDRFWTRASEDPRGNPVVAMAAEPPGICVVIGKVTRERPRQWPLLHCELTSALWHGMRSSTKRGWWQGARSLSDVLNEDGEAAVAVVGIVIEAEDGSRRPYHFGYMFDPISRKWILVKVNTGNYDRPGSPMEF